MALKRRSFLFLRPNKLHTFKVRAWDRNTESDFSDPITLHTSERPGIGWYKNYLNPRPIWWNKQIKVTWNAVHPSLKKWVDEYMLFRLSVSEDNSDADYYPDPPTDEQWDTIIDTSKTQLENSPYYIQSFKKLLTYFDGDIVPDSNFNETDDDDSWDYYYWVIAVDDEGIASTSTAPGVTPVRMGHLGPRYASWGPPEAPIWQGGWETIVHDFNKWWCDVKVVWRQKGGCEYYIFQWKRSDKALWGLPVKIWYDDTFKHGNTSDEYRYVILKNFLVNTSYDFRIRAVNIVGILKSAFVERNGYTTEIDPDPPAEIQDVAARRTWYSGLDLFQQGAFKGEYIKVNWSMPINPILSEQLDHYEIWRLVGTDTEADAYKAEINALAGEEYGKPVGEGTPYTSSMQPYAETQKFLGTQWIDDEVDGQTGTSGQAFDFNWGMEGDDATARLTATVSGSPVVGVVTGAVVIDSADAYSGTYSMEIPTSSAYVTFNNVADQSVDGDSGYISFWYKGQFSSPINYYLFLAQADALNFMYIWGDGATGVQIYRRGNAISHTATIPWADVAAANPFANWVNYEFRWNVSLNKLEARVAGGTWYSQAGTLQAMTAVPSNFDIGGNSAVTPYRMDQVGVSLSYTPTPANINYHYWVRGVDVYNKKSVVTGPYDSPNQSYDQVSFAPPDQPENVGYDTNQTRPLLFGLKKAYLISIHWDPEDEATHYQVRLRFQRPGTKPLTGQPYDWTRWVTSPLLEASRHVVDDPGDDEYGKVQYTYPLAVNYNWGVEAKVRALNRAGVSNEWDDISEISFTVLKDTEAPGNVDESTFIGDCMGVVPLFGPDNWVGVNLKWKPRPKSEAVTYYAIDVRNPAAPDKSTNHADWTSLPQVAGRTVLDSKNFWWVRASVFYLGIQLPPENRHTTENQFRIKAYDEDEVGSELFAYTTVNFERWWVL